MPVIAHEQVSKMEVTEASSRDNNKRVEDARRALVAKLVELRRKSASEEEYNTARTQFMRTELDVKAFDTVASTELDSPSSSSCVPDGLPAEQLERMHEENRSHFQHLLDEERPSIVANWIPRVLPGYDHGFYVVFKGRLEAGQWIGGGGQADIHEAILDGQLSTQWVLKVFRSDYSLAELQRSWVKDIAHFFRPVALQSVPYDSVCIVIHGTLLRSGRFAFVLERCWGDLRKAIDFEIVKDTTHGSPSFPHSTTVKIMYDISSAMWKLHSSGILHKDLKAANCLLVVDIAKRQELRNVLVADFDSPEGVVGTGFWRAPEVLLALNKKVSDLEKVDIYSYAMTCYEVLKGCIPFEDRAANDYDNVINGERPLLPDYVDPKLQELIRRCWHPNPSERPSFEDCSKFFLLNFTDFIIEGHDEELNSLSEDMLLEHDEEHNSLSEDVLLEHEEE